MLHHGTYSYCYHLRATFRCAPPWYILLLLLYHQLSEGNIQVCSTMVCSPILLLSVIGGQHSGVLHHVMFSYIVIISYLRATFRCAPPWYVLLLLLSHQLSEGNIQVCSTMVRTPTVIISSAIVFSR